MPQSDFNLNGTPTSAEMQRFNRDFVCPDSKREGCQDPDPGEHRAIECAGCICSPVAWTLTYRQQNTELTEISVHRRVVRGSYTVDSHAAGFTHTLAKQHCRLDWCGNHRIRRSDCA